MDAFCDPRGARRLAVEWSLRRRQLMRAADHGAVARPARLRTRCARPHRHRSWVKKKVLRRVVAIRECCPATLPSHPARYFTASLRLPLLRYGIRRLYTLLWLHGRQNQRPPFWLARCGLYGGLGAAFGSAMWSGIQFLEFLRLQSLLYIILRWSVVRDSVRCNVMYMHPVYVAYRY